MASKKGRESYASLLPKDQTLCRRGAAELKGPRALGTPKGSANAPSWAWVASAGTIVGLAFVLRIYRIAAQEVWYDEAISFYMATTGDAFRSLLIEDSPPLYYLLLRGWVALVGQGEAALRMPSAIAGTLCVAAVIWAGREILDARAGLWSGVVAAVAPIHIYYSQEARAYVFLTLFLALTYGALWRAFATNQWRWWSLVSVGTLLAFYTHYFALLGLLPTAGLALLWPDKERWQRYGVALLGSGLLFMPWFK